MMPLRDILRWCTLVGLAGGILSCQLPDRYLIYPKELPVHVQSWTEDVDKGPLRLHLVWAKPVGAGPWPTVLVHPDGSATAADMRGVLWNLASLGYLAIAADYRRLHNGTYQRTLFPWCEAAEMTTVLEILRAQPWVDGQRLAALGFSQGGIFSLLLAAQSPAIKAVVAYYPVTDFPRWLAAPRAPFLKRLVFHFIREYFRHDAERCPGVTFQTVLDNASALYQAERIQVPVLLIHGDQDGAAPVEESRRLAARLAALDRDVELVVIAGGRHVFNFKQPTQAQEAWQVTLQWLARHLGLALAGEIAEGAVMQGAVAAPLVAWFLAQVRRGAQRVGRSVHEVDMVSRVNLCLHPDARVAKDVMRPAIARSLITQYPHFRTFTTAGLEIPAHLQDLIATVGYTHDPAVLAPVAAQVPDAFVDAVTLAGTVEDVATCVRRMAQQGIKHIMIYPQAPDGDVERVLTCFAQEVIPRVRA